MNDDASSTVTGFGFILTGVFDFGLKDEERVDLLSAFAGRQKLFLVVEEWDRRSACSSISVSSFPTADFFFVFAVLSFSSSVLLLSSSMTGSIAVNGGLGGGAAAAAEAGRSVSLSF